MTKIKFKKLALAAATTAAVTMTAHAQSSDAIIDKLVEKGILTTKEAQDLRDEADKSFSTAIASKFGMADWVQALKFSGDVRGRYEGFYAHSPLFIDRDRLRYRLRFNVVAQLMDDFEAGFRLASGDLDGGINSGIDPLSNNQSFQNNASKKGIFVDLAYGKWTPFKGPSLTGGFTIGKMENPFIVDDMVFDPDYTPEGLAAQFGWRINDKHSLKFNGAWFVLDESGSKLQDPFLFGGQIRWDALWNTKWSSTVGLTALAMESAGNLTTASVPDINRGNARLVNTELAYPHNPIIIDAAVTYNLDSFPFYTGPFPIKVSGEYMNNPAAPQSADNYAYNFGVTLGKSGKRHTWEVGYTWKWLGADAAWEELVDSDFGALYGAANSPANSGSGIGYGAGTNVKGHIVRFAYSPSDSWTLSAKLFMTSLINAYPAGGNSDMNRVQVDAIWKF